MAELVAVRLPRPADLLDAWDRVLGLGDAVLPIAPDLPDAAVERIVRTLRPAALLQPDPAGEPRVHRLPDPLAVPDDAAVVVATSGSTGRPKGVLLSRRALAAATTASVRRLGCQGGERWLLCLPLSHVAGLQVVLRSRALGAAPVLHDRFDVAAVARTVRAGEVAWVSLVPTQLSRLLDADVDLSPLRGVLLGGAAPGPDLLGRAAAAGVAVTVSYGMTETGGGCVYDGRALDGVEVDVAADGRIRFRGDTLMDGYHGREDLTAAVMRDGWFTSDDLGRWTQEGRLEVLGRADDVIVSGGENVSAAAVARAVESHPLIRAAVVVGQPDPEWGQRVTAVCECLPGDPPDLGALRDHLRDDLPPAALPRELVVVDALPRDRMGKPTRSLVLRLLAQD